MLQNERGIDLLEEHLSNFMSSEKSEKLFNLLDEYRDNLANGKSNPKPDFTRRGSEKVDITFYSTAKQRNVGEVVGRQI